MARPLRIDYPGACYPVMNRGNQRQVVFRQALECELFLAKLAAAATTFGMAEAAGNAAVLWWRHAGGYDGLR